MTRKVIIVGHVDHAHCSDVIASFGMADKVECIHFESKKEMEEKLGTDCSAVFPTEIPKSNFGLETIKNPILVELKESPVKGHQRPYKFHR